MAKSQAESNLDDPKEMFAWMFAAGVPDPRGEQFHNQPLIPPMCYGALSEMLYNMGARFVPEEQKVWLETPKGPTRNFSVAATTDIKPEDIKQDLAEFAADQFPEIAARVAAVSPENIDEAGREATAKLLDSLERLRQARESLESMSSQAAPAPAPAPEVKEGSD